MLVEEKVAVITGAASGIGEVTAKLYGDRNAKVIAADVDETAGSETVGEIIDDGGDAMFVRADVSQSADVRELIETAVETYGGVDILVNNAGIEGEFAEITEYGEDAFDAVIDVNLKGVFLGTKYGIEAMLETGGAIVNTSSIAAAVGVPGQSGYAATKAGIDSLTKVAAIEYADRNIRVNAVLPGIVDTPMATRAAERERPVNTGNDVTEAMPGYGQPEDIAAAVLFLGSDFSSRITGVTLPVDGGFLASA